LSKTTIIYIEPKIYDEAMQITDHLRQGNPVVINLKHLDPPDDERLINFVSGAAFGIDGHMLQVGENIYLFTPSNIIISDEEDTTSLR